MRAGYNAKLRDYVERIPSRAGLVAEVAQIVGSSVKTTSTDWQASATTGTIARPPFGGATIGGSASSVITQASDDGTQVTGLNQIAPFNVLMISWLGSGAENRELANVVARLDPRADGGVAKDAAFFVCQLFRVTEGGNPGSDTTVVPISTPRSVAADGEVAADFTFDFRTAGRAPLVGSPPPFTSRPTTMVKIWAVTSTGAQASNVAWMADSTITTGIAGAEYSVQHHTANQLVGSSEGGGSVYLISLVVETMPRFTINRASYSAATVDFTGANAIPDLPGAGDLVITARGETPSDSTLTYYIDDAGGEVECVDGDKIGEDNTALGGKDLTSISTTGPWDMRVALAPSSDGFRAPTVYELGVERVVSTFLTGVATMSDGSRQVDPLTLKSNIPRAQCRIEKSGEKDYDDYGTRIIAGNHIGDVQLRFWVADLTGTYLTRPEWMLHSTWDIDDYVNGEGAHVFDLLSPVRRLRRPIPRFVVSAGNDGTRTPLDYTDDIAAVYEDLLDTISEVPTRLIGEGCTDTTTQIAKIIQSADLKDEMDAVAYLEGRTVTESQGRIKALPVMRDDFGADTPIVYYPVGSYDPITIGPGFTARTDEVFVQYGWNDTRERFEDERRYLNATALSKLGGVGLNTTHSLDERISRWITTEAQADSVGRRVVNHFFSGLILWRIKAHIRNPALEIGDVVSITTDQFVGRNPITDEEIRGPLSALAIVARVGDFWGTDLDLWVPGYEYITVGEGTTTRSGFNPDLAIQASVSATPAFHADTREGHVYEIALESIGDDATHMRVSTSYDYTNETGPGTGPFVVQHSVDISTGPGVYVLPSGDVNGFLPSNDGVNEQYYRNVVVSVWGRVTVGGTIYDGAAQRLTTEYVVNHTTRAQSTADGTILFGDYLIAGNGLVMDADAAGRPRIRNGYNVKDYGAIGDGVANDSTAFANTLSAVPSGGGYVHVPAGTYLITSTLTVPRGVTVMGAGSRATTISHTANGRCFDLHGDGSDIVHSARHIRGLRITGNSGAAAIGIALGDTYRTSLVDVLVADYTGGIGIRLGNDDQWTEGTVFDNVHVRNCAVCIQFDASGAGTNSFAETRFTAVGVVASAAGQVGVELTGGAFVYGSTLNIKGNLESTSTCVFLKTNGTDDRIDGSLVALYVESSTAAGVGVELASGSWITGTGRFDIDSALTKTFNAASGITLAGNSVVYTPATLAASVTSFNPQDATTIRATGASGGTSVHGIALTTASHGRRLRFVNLAADTITFVNQSGTEATATRRLIVPNTTVLGIDDACDLEYDVLSGRWRVVGLYS